VLPVTSNILVKQDMGSNWTRRKVLRAFGNHTLDAKIILTEWYVGLGSNMGEWVNNHIGGKHKW
jgi:hypothetical protein